MNNFHANFLFIFLLLLSLNAVAQTNAVVAKIEVDNIEGSLKLKAIAKNAGDLNQSLNYIFVAVKKDQRKNMSSSQQENKFVLLPNETKILSEIAINIGKDDALKVYLFIKDEKTAKLVAKDSLELNPKNFNIDASYEKASSEENMQLKGLIINETKTRVGDDFYGKFYSVLMLNDLTFNFRVLVSEIPSTGKNTQLQVFANDENILTFVARPEDDYLNEAVKQTIVSLIKYEKDQQVDDKGFIY
ncbi:hypothetical protein FNJ88_00070 [Chryseobacterium sp. SNU WT5]|uniref:CsgE family curli-type amyloid fiber assembly protein n=1 Tax=Chryseobacterium sp. SNU WT5 TaxID=2594269 RepID=UPI00117E9324|nr:CsgE family curli-type amyloid fiber assembly protein [Chryseobacterium sp. SNU WT5]QDP84020.1 hypothetical protein FNJ88_00070 [Chryseobacterium sp. SNU WT5]